jgi:uncharacterized membrane protein
VDAQGRGMATYLLVKTLHIISATIVFGTGIGIANFTFLGYFVFWLMVAKPTW